MKISPSLFFAFPLLCASLFGEGTSYDVNLKDPVYDEGILSTESGGVVTSPDLRIQARSIKYVDREEEGKKVRKIFAEGDLLIINGERVFKGETLEYNLVDKTGVITGAKASVDVIFIGAEKIELKEDGTFYIKEAFLTTSENLPPLWELRLKNITVDDQSVLTAKHVLFKAFDIPVMYFPYFSSNLKNVGDPPVRYQAMWEKGQGPKLSMRYRAYSDDDKAIFLRFDYRVNRGFGGAIETDAKSQSRKSRMKTKNYYAYDTFFNDVNPNKPRKRYRFQGILDSEDLNPSTSLHLVYDKISDRAMPGDFKSDNFELNTQKRTEMLLRTKRENVLLGFNVRPKINNFQSLRQELPDAFINVRTLEFGESGILMKNNFRASYLDYKFASRVEDFLKDFHSARLETKNSIYRPFHYGGLNFTPEAGVIGIFYENSQNGDARGQGIGFGKVEADYPLRRAFGNARHVIKPFGQYQIYSFPTSKVDEHFIFGVSDGYNRLSELTLGVKNAFYRTQLLPTFTLDLYARGFFSESTFSKTFPKGYMDTSLRLSRALLEGSLGVNFEENVLDYGNIALGYTINRDLAFRVEYRHRSRFYWRRSSPDNFMMEVTRSIDELLDSPLSDGRNTILTRFEAKIAPRWTLRLSTHHGWGRGDDPAYNEGKLDLFALLSSHWKMRMTYTQTVRTSQFVFNLAFVR